MDLESTPLFLKSNFVTSRTDQAAIPRFHTDQGSYVGQFVIRYNTTTIRWKMSYCQDDLGPFPTKLPPSNEEMDSMIWMISKNITSLSVTCNRVLVLEYTFSQSTDKCIRQWKGDKVNTLEINYGNDSDSYCIGFHCFYPIPSEIKGMKYSILYFYYRITRLSHQSPTDTFTLSLF